MRSVGMHAVAPRSAADARRLEPCRFDKNIFRLLRDHGVEAAHHPGQGDCLLGISDDQVFGMQLALHAVECFQSLAFVGPTHDDLATLQQIKIESVGGVAHLDERVIAGVYRIVDRAGASRPQPLCHGFLRSPDVHPANHPRRIPCAAFGILNVDGKFRSGFGRRQLCLQRLEINIEHRRAFPRDAAVAHAIHAVGGDLHLEDGLPVLVADGFHRCSGVRQVFRQFAVLGLQCDEFTKPIG